MLSPLMLALATWGAPPSVPDPVVPALAAFACSTTRRQGETTAVTSTRCTPRVDVPDRELWLEAMRFQVFQGRAPSVDTLCRADLQRRYAMVFESIHTATPSVVQRDGKSACRVELVGTRGAGGGPWQMVDLTVPVDDTSWLVISAQGRPAEFARHRADVDRFLADTRAR